MRVGLLGKVFGPIGFVAAVLRGTFPPLFGLTILTNDLIWWIPFAMILWDAAKHRSGDRPRRCARTTLRKAESTRRRRLSFGFMNAPKPCDN